MVTICVLAYLAVGTALAVYEAVTIKQNVPPVWFVILTLAGPVLLAIGLLGCLLDLPYYLGWAAGYLARRWSKGYRAARWED